MPSVTKRNSVPPAILSGARGVMRQHEDGRVIRRLVAPPALPAVVRPRASDRTEHVAPKNPGADSGKTLLRDPVIHSRFAVVMAVHRPPYAQGEEPLH